MALPAFASSAELSAWLGESCGVDDSVRAAAVLAAASTLIRSHTGRVWVDANGDPEAGVTAAQLDTLSVVTVMVAARVWTNPNGRVSQTAGPFSESYERGLQGLVLTESERRMLSPVLGGVPGLSSVRVAAPRFAAGVPAVPADGEWIL